VSHSVLLQLARSSIEEVLQAKQIIDKVSLTQQYPLLKDTIPTSIHIYLNKELRGSYSINSKEKSLVENIIICAKKAAFEDRNSAPLSALEYLQCEIEIILQTLDGQISEINSPILKQSL